MCAVSAVHQGYMQQYPSPSLFPMVEWAKYQELVRKAAEYDRLTNQPDCPAPDKLQWQKELERVMAEKCGLQPLK